jgi:protein NEDD1
MIESQLAWRHVTSTRCSNFLSLKVTAGFAMLAISTAQSLSLVDQVTLRNPPSSIPSDLPLPAPATASVWSQDNAALFVAFPDSIHQYSSSGSHIGEIYSSVNSISSLVVKDKGQVLILSESNKVQVLEYGSGTGKVTQTMESHKSRINSLSLSNDSTLLASVSSSAVHVHNLSLGSHTVLRGLPQVSGQITTCAFHPHSRTRLLLGMGQQLLVYDTARPSGPMKVIPMGDASCGDIVELACSPFSKTLIAVATSGGNVGLVDLDKEKGYVCPAI